MNRTKQQPSKFSRFLRNNAALLLLIFCVLAITAVVLAVTLTRNAPVVDGPVANNPNDDLPNNDDPAPTTKKVQVFFAAPVKYTGIGMGFTDKHDNPFEYNNTLQVWAAHKALDLLANEGAEVTAMFDGTVIEVKTTYREGTFVVIDHGDNVIATYGSLQNVPVSKGQAVKKGDLIGEISVSATSEYMDGAHLHLEIVENGVSVNPTPYIEGKMYREFEVQE